MSLQRMQKARTGLIISEPFFGALSMRLELVEDPATKTTWTDGKRIGFNPEWATNESMDVLEAVFAHQIATCAFGHHTRRGARDAKLWNDASDHCVNHELARSGFRLPIGALMAPEFDGMHAEAIYAILAERQSQQSDAGESSTGRVDDATNEQGDSADADEIKTQESEWQVAVAQAAQVARAACKLPGGIERKVDAFVNSKVAWREALQRYLNSRAKDDYNWSRPNRRYMPSAYLPSLDSPRMGVLAVAVDCSGSVISRVTEFISEIDEIRQTVQPEKIIVMVFDMIVRQQYVFEKGEPINVKAITAGGSTAFDDPARVLEREGVTPEALIFLTDLDGRFGPAPDYPVLWVCTNAGMSAPFGEIIEML
jgi:predicted metal-dependent peptidase